MELKFVLSLLWHLKFVEYATSRCRSVMFKDEKFDVVNFPPPFESCKGDRLFIRASDQKLFCMARTPNNTKSDTLSCAAQASEQANSQEESQNRVARGEELTKNLYPWLTLITLHFDPTGPYFNSTCGGSIISNRAILTAAHCFKGMIGMKQKIYIGAHNKSESKLQDEATEIKVNAIIHERYGAGTIFPDKNDIGILITEDEIEFNEIIQPICLPIKSDSIDSATNIFAGGWGVKETLMEWLTRNKNFIAKEYSENDYGKDVINMLFNQVKGVFGGIENYISKDTLAFNVQNKGDFAEALQSGLRNFLSNLKDPVTIEEGKQYIAMIGDSVINEDFSTVINNGTERILKYVNFFKKKIFGLRLPSDVPKRALLQLIGTAECKNRSPVEIHDKLADMLCFKEKYHDSGTICSGDTGSPVISTRGGSIVQFGIVHAEIPTSLEKYKAEPVQDTFIRD